METAQTNHRAWAADCIMATNWLGYLTTLSVKQSMCVYSVYNATTLLFFTSTHLHTTCFDLHGHPQVTLVKQHRTL
jgi:hypothetical protein